MKRLPFLSLIGACVLLVLTGICPAAVPVGKRIGIIGLDTSHSPEFTKIFNDPKAGADLLGYRVVAAYPRGSADIESSVSRVPEYTEAVRKMGVEIVGSVDELVKRVDVVLLETCDGRPHLEQVIPVLRAHKPVFVDKPVAASLVDAVLIYDLAQREHTPIFSASSLRFVDHAAEFRAGSLGKLTTVETYSPCKHEEHHPDLFWYGIHGVEPLYAVLGPGCQTVRRSTTYNDPQDIVTGTWPGGRTGIFRGKHNHDNTGWGGYGGQATGEKGTAKLGNFHGYRPLVVAIAQFFHTGKAPVDPQETLEIYAFMEAADKSRDLHGQPVSVPETLAAAEKAAMAKLAKLEAGGK